MTTVTVNSIAYSDAGETSRDMRDGGHRTYLLQMISNLMVQINSVGLGTSISNVTVVTGTGAQTVANNEGTIVWAPSTPADATFTLPAAPTLGQGHVLVYRHTSGIQYRMTIAANTGHTINGLSSIVLQSAWAWVEVRYTATNQWTVTRSSGPMPNLARVSTTAMASTIARSISVVGRYAYIGNSGGTEAFEIWDVSRPSAPVLAGSVAMSAGGSLGGLIVAGRYAYVTQNNSAAALAVIDVSNPTAPTVVKAMSVGGVVGRAMALSGHYLLLGHGGNANLRVLDISDPANPVLVASLALTSVTNINAIAIAGKYAYVGTTTSGTTGFHVVDISAPASPTEVATFQTTSTGIHAVTVSGRYAYLGGSAAASGLQILNIANPAAPASIATLATNFGATSAAPHMPLAGSFLYFPGAGITNALQVIDVTDPATPVSVGAVSIALASPQDLAVAGRHLYMVANTNTNADGFRIYDISGLNLPAATIGALQTDVLHVDGHAHFDKDLYVNGGITAGRHGIMTRGGLSVGGLSYFGDNLGIGMTRAPAGLSLGVGKDLRDYNSFTDASNGEWGEFAFVANVLHIGTNQNGTGAVRNLRFNVGGTNRLDYGVTTASTWTLAAAVRMTSTLHVGDATGVGGGVGSRAQVVQAADGIGVVIARSSANPYELRLGVNQATGYAEIQGAQGGVDFKPLLLNRQGGNVGIRTPSLVPQAMLHVGETAGTARVYNAYTDASNGEWAYLGDWASNIARYGTDKNGTGTAREMQLMTGGVIGLRMHATSQLIALGPAAAFTASFPALKRSSTELQARLGDDSAYAPFAALDLKATSIVSSLGLGTDSAGKLVNIATRVRTTADFPKTSDTTLANVTGLSASLAAAGTYIIRGTLFVSSTVNGGFKMALASGDTLTATSYRASATLLTSANGGATQTASGLGVNFASTTPIMIAMFWAVIVVNAAGTLVVQAAQNASHVDTTTVQANSFMEVIKIG